MVTLYGISNCDTVRKARRWLEANGVDYTFHDLRTDGLDDALLERWMQEPGWERLLNRRSATWRRLPAAQRDVTGPEAARKLMRAHPTLIRRPLLDTGHARVVGFDTDRFARLFQGRHT